MEKQCTLTNEELAEKLNEWAASLARTGGKSWSLQVPVNFNKDPDMLMIEAAKRLLDDGWINADDALPEIIEDKDCSENVLAIVKGCEEIQVMSTGLGYVWRNCHGNINGHPEDDDNYTVTHWRPIPKPPKAHP